MEISMTERLYYSDSHLAAFEAEVVSCTPSGKGYYVTVLDRTAFFPEGGGQPGDTGVIGDVPVTDTHEKDGDVCHYTSEFIEPGSYVKCSIDWGRRFNFMQNHSGEHIVSGIVHSMTGFNNVGFHMSEGFVTVDFDGELTGEQLEEIERTANGAVWENREVRAWFPAAAELKDIEYRSKLDITEGVRLVTIDGYDTCACCAPHVKRTGEIGVIKITDFMRHRGGVRITMVCGGDALADYCTKQDNVRKISVLLSAKPEETAGAVQRVKQELAQLKTELAEFRRQVTQSKIAGLKPTEGNMCIFEEKLDMQSMRELVNAGMELCTGICAGFVGNDNDGYNYVIGSKYTDLRTASREINSAIEGRGGGKPEMIQGSAAASRRSIEEYFLK